MLAVDIRSSRELQDLVRTLKSADRKVAQAVRAQSRAVIRPLWQKAVTENALTVYETRLASTARASVSDQNVTLQAAKVRGKKFSGGLDLRESWVQVERGSNVGKTTTYDRTSRKGKVHSVTRHTMAGFRPRQKGGYVLGPARKELGPRVLSLWVQTAIRTLLDEIEKR